MYYTLIESPIGKLLLVKDQCGLRMVHYVRKGMEGLLAEEWERKDEAFEEERTQFQEYFAGQRKVFQLKLAIEGTPFQQDVLQALRKIPFGTTRSYKDIAEAVGSPKAARAVGMANNRNPLSIVIPCHRVVGANGDLVGYAGGLDIKRKLLEIENRT